MKIDKNELIIFMCCLFAVLAGMILRNPLLPIGVKLTGADMVAEFEFKTDSAIKGTGADIATEVANELK